MTCPAVAPLLCPSPGTATGFTGTPLTVPSPFTAALRLHPTAKTWNPGERGREDLSRPLSHPGS
jgi:hypothetical protein